MTEVRESLFPNVPRESAAQFVTALQEIRVLLHDVEMFVDERHTSKVAVPDCPACPLVGRLRSMSETLGREILRTDRPNLANGGYQIALRHDDLGLDDVVVKDVEVFRMERMDDDYVWLCCYLADGQRIDFDLHLHDKRKKTIVYKAREPLPDAVYEAGSHA